MINLQEIVNNEYFGNPMYNYLIALGILIGFVLLGKILEFFMKKHVNKFIGKTKTKIDDIIFQSLEKPFLLFFFAIGLIVVSFFIIMSEGAKLGYFKLIKSLIIFALAWFFINVVDLLIEYYLTPYAKKSETDLDDILMPVLRKLMKTVLVIIAFVMILSDLGFDVASILAGLGIGGLAFALAAKDLLANLFGGIAIIMDKSFKPGQRIRVAGVDGKVKTIGLRTTVIESFDGTKLTIPNAKVADSIIENVSHESARKVSLTIGVSCDTSNKKLETAIKELKKIIDAHKNVKDKTIVRFSKFGDFTLDISIIYWISNLKEIGGTTHDINMAIKKKVEELKIEMPFPTQTIKLKK